MVYDVEFFLLDSDQLQKPLDEKGLEAACLVVYQLLREDYYIELKNKSVSDNDIQKDEKLKAVLDHYVQGLPYKAQLEKYSLLYGVDKSTGKVIVAIGFRTQAMLSERNRTIDVQHFAVDMECRSQGIGTAAVCWFQQWAKDQGYVGINVTVSNDRLLKFVTLGKNPYISFGGKEGEETFGGIMHSTRIGIPLTSNPMLVKEMSLWDQVSVRFRQLLEVLKQKLYLQHTEKALEEELIKLLPRTIQTIPKTLVRQEIDIFKDGLFSQKDTKTWDGFTKQYLNEKKSKLVPVMEIS